MMGRLDCLVAFGLAAGVHVAGFGYIAATVGFEGAGDEGRAVLSLQAASPGIADLITQWETTPEVSQVMASLEAPEMEPEFAKVDAWTDPSLAGSVSKLDDAPAFAAPPEVGDAASPVLAAVDTPQSQVARVATDVGVARIMASRLPRMSPSAPVFEVPKVVERAVLTTPRPPARPQQADPVPALVARGTGGGVSAGALGATRAVATLAPAARAAAQADWAQKIQSRIARHQVYPRGARGQGRVRLHMDIRADGALSSVRIDRSSGVAALDRAALRAAKAAAPFPPAPDGLNRSEYGFAQWVNFAR